MVRWIYNFSGIEQDADVQAVVQTARPTQAGEAELRDDVTARLYQVLFFDFSMSSRSGLAGRRSDLVHGGLDAAAAAPHRCNGGEHNGR